MAKRRILSSSSSAYLSNEQFLDIEIDEIENNPMQPRIHIDVDCLQELASSISQYGLIQPISVIKSDSNRYILQAGQRRVMAHKILGLKHIKAIVYDNNLAIFNDKSLFEVAVIENIQRDNLDAIEFALSLKQAMSKKLYKNLDELSIAIGKSKSYISKVMKVLQLDNDIIKDLAVNKSTNDIEALYELQKITEPVLQKKIYNDFVTKKIDRKALRSIVKNNNSHAKQKNSYKLKVTNKRIGLEIELAELSNEKKTKLEKEIRGLLEKHLFF